MDQKTELVAKTFILNSDGKILVLRRSESDPRRPLTWDLPGGVVEFGEDPTLAAIREAREESGLIIESPRIFNIISSNDSFYLIRLMYSARSSESEITLSFEHNQYKWVTKDELASLDIPVYYKDACKLLASL